MVWVGLLGNHEVARRSAFSAAYKIQTGSDWVEEGCLRVGIVVFQTPWYHELSHHRSDPGFTFVVKARACDHLAMTTW